MLREVTGAHKSQELTPMTLIPTIHYTQSGTHLNYNINLCDVIIVVGVTTIAITFTIFFALHSPGELEREDGFRQLPTISLTGM